MSNNHNWNASKHEEQWGHTNNQIHKSSVTKTHIFLTGLALMLTITMALLTHFSPNLFVSDVPAVESIQNIADVPGSLAAVRADEFAVWFSNPSTWIGFSVLSSVMLFCMCALYADQKQKAQKNKTPPQ